MTVRHDTYIIPEDILDKLQYIMRDDFVENDLLLL